jgi:hypothetical protein
MDRPWTLLLALVLVAARDLPGSSLNPSNNLRRSPSEFSDVILHNVCCNTAMQFSNVIMISNVILFSDDDTTIHCNAVIIM